MHHVLLLDPDVVHARQVASALESICCQTTMVAAQDFSAAFISEGKFDAVVVVSFGGSGWYGFMEAVRRAALQTICPPEIIALLRTPYRDPAEKVFAARKGFKVVYEW